jgi:hypothetical protein
MQNTQDVAEATGWCRIIMPSRETSIAIEVAKEEKSAKRIIAAKRWSKDLKNKTKICR